MQKYRSQTIILEEINRVRTENRIGKKHLRRRRRINEEVRSNQPFKTSDDDATEVQSAGWYRSKNWSQQNRTDLNN